MSQLDALAAAHHHGQSPASAAALSGSKGTSNFWDDVWNGVTGAVRWGADCISHAVNAVINGDDTELNTTPADPFSYAVYDLPYDSNMAGVDASLITSDGASILSHDGGTLIGDGGSELLTSDGASAISNNGSSFRSYALANFTENRWDFLDCAENGLLDFSKQLGHPLSDYQSPAGNLYIAPLLYDEVQNRQMRVRGITPIICNPGDLTPAPAVPNFQATPVNGGLYFTWDNPGSGPLVVNVFLARQIFSDPVADGAFTLTFPAADGEGIFLSSLTTPVYVAAQARNMGSCIDGVMTPVTQVTPISGAGISGLALKVDANPPEGRIGEQIALTATGADTYDWDLDADGVYDVSGDLTGTAITTSGGLGINYVRVRGHTAAGGLALRTVAIQRNDDWTHSIGFHAKEDVFSAVAGDEHGNTYAVGYTTLASGSDQDALVCKYDTGGRLVWARTENNGFIGSEYLMAVAVDASGIYCSGSMSNINTGGLDLLVVKLDADGNVLWKQTWNDGSNNFDDFPPRQAPIALDPQGNAYVGTENDMGDTALLKFDAAGQLAWQKSTGNSIARLNGLTYDAASSTLVGVGPGAGVAKFDTSGSLLWAKTYDLNQALSTNTAYGVVTDGSSNIYISGGISGGAGTGPAFLLKLSPTGTALADITWDSGVIGFYQGFNALIWGADGNLYTGGLLWDKAGTGQRSGTLCKFNNNLLELDSKQWDPGAGNNAEFDGITPTFNDGRLALAGYASNITGSWVDVSPVIAEPSVNTGTWTFSISDANGTLNPPAPNFVDASGTQNIGDGFTDGLALKRGLP